MQQLWALPLSLWPLRVLDRLTGGAPLLSRNMSRRWLAHCCWWQWNPITPFVLSESDLWIFSYQSRDTMLSFPEISYANITFFFTWWIVLNGSFELCMLRVFFWEGQLHVEGIPALLGHPPSIASGGIMQYASYHSYYPRKLCMSIVIFHKIQSTQWSK